MPREKISVASTAAILGRAAALTAAYVGIARLSLVLGAVDGLVSPFWPPAGFAIAVLTLGGLRFWPVVAVGALAVNLPMGIPLAASAGICLGNTAEAVIGAAVLRHFNVKGEVAEVGCAIAIMAVALLAPLPSAIGGILSLSHGRPVIWGEYRWALLIWWLGDLMGILTVLPAMLAWAGRRVATPTPARPLEFVGVSLMSAAALTFVYLRPGALAAFGVDFLPAAPFLVPAVVWGLLRLRQRETLLILAVTMAGAAVFSKALYPPQDVLGSLMFHELILLSLSGGTLLVMGALAERDEALAVQHAAEAADQAKSRFVVIIRHDLGQPLQALQLFISALQGRVKGDEESTLLHRMGGAVQAMSTTLAALGDLALVESGQERASVEQFTLTELMAQIADEYQPQLAEKGLRLRFVPCTCAVETDPQLLGRILRNLMSNALRYTERGSVLFGCRRQPGGGVRMQICDTGPGIPDHDLANVFRSFYRGAAPPQRPVADDGGLGLGLATVDRLARLLGLDVTLRSRVGKGTMFSVTVPAGTRHSGRKGVAA